MESLAGYVALVFVSVIATYLSQFLRPKVKIRYWLPHSFIFTIPNNQANPASGATQIIAPDGSALTPPAAPPNYFLHTQALTIRNFGRESSEWIEITHRRKPDFFQLYPPLNYTESTAPGGEHILRAGSLASKESFTIQFLGYTHMPELVIIRSSDGHASLMPWMTVRKYPRWVYITMQVAMFAGVAFLIYWLIRGGLFALKYAIHGGS
jgi:hypothetical protein